MLSLKKTSLWLGSFSGKQFQEEKESLNFLESAFEDIRSHAIHLVAQIAKDLPDYTVHDITHLDALWETASLVAGKTYPLNPAEAFIFGVSVLFHDAAMSLAAYPKGLTSISMTHEWRDVVAARYLSAFDRMPSAEEIERPHGSILKEIISDFLREAHAKRAGELPFLEWSVDGNAEYLIQNTELRNAYGSIIGKIASSHWWPVSDLANLPEQQNAGPGVPADWTVSPVKIACLLRAADIAHIDHRRAPRFLRALVQPKGISDAHWGFQSKIQKPAIKNDFLVYTGGPFGINEAKEWWLCYEALNAIDNELHAIHALLEDQGVPIFKAVAVKGAKLPSTVARLIQTQNWKPVDTVLRVSNVPSLVEKLGGRHLYGDDLRAPIREMLQNAADAIRARRKMLERPSDWGQITVKLDKQDDADWLEFEDNGIGMSSRVLTGPLLDFGNSFWRSALLPLEFPGLLSKGVKTTGKFGIGFFSVFMLGKRVTVTSRRFDLGDGETHTLDFQNGLEVRPILRSPFDHERLSDGGTRVRVALEKRFNSEGGLLFRGKSSPPQSLVLLINEICVSLDANVVIHENGDCLELLKANQWITQNPRELIQIANQAEITGVPHIVFKNLRLISGSTKRELYGRALIWPSASFYATGAITVGGFRHAAIRNILGILDGEANTAARNSGTPTIPPMLLQAWACEQALLLAVAPVSGYDKLRCGAIVRKFGGDSSPLPILESEDGFFTVADAIKHFSELDEIWIHDGGINYDESEDEHIAPEDFRDSFKPRVNLFIAPQDIKDGLQGDHWPPQTPEFYKNGMLQTWREIVDEIVQRSWGEEFEVGDGRDVVGEVNGEEIEREVLIYTRHAKIDVSDLL